MNYLSISQAAEALGISKKAVKSRIRRGTLSYVEAADGERLIPDTEVTRILGSSPEAAPVNPSKVLAEAQAILNGHEESREAQLERELIDARAESKQLSQIIRQYNERTRLEDRVAYDIKQALNSNPYSPRLAQPKPEVNPDAEHEMLLLVSDAHYPEIVNPDEAMGIEFGPEVVRRRMEYIVDRTIRLKNLHENNFPVKKITVAVLGDMLSGNIHEELEITNAVPIAQALPEMAYMLHDMGSIFAQEVPEVEMIVMPGNHPRMTKKPRYKQKWDNFEYIMGKFVEALAGDDYKVVVPKDMMYVHNIFDQRIGLYHGDGSKAASFAGIPFYGLKQRADATQAMLSNLGHDRLNMLIMGHYHQLLNWTAGDCHVMINGAIKGGDEFSIGTRSSAIDPVQALLTFHKDRGWIGSERIPLKDV